MKPKMLFALFHRAALQSFVAAVLNPERERFLNRDFRVGGVEPRATSCLALVAQASASFFSATGSSRRLLRLIDIVDHPCGLFCAVGLPASLTN